MAKGRKTEPELISGSELARRLGVTETAVRKAIKAGRIVAANVDEKGKRWFIESTARRQWGMNTLPEKSTGKRAVPAPNDVTLDANKVKNLIGVAQARILTFKARKLEQELVGVEDVARMWERQVEQAKRLFLALPVELRMLIPTLTTDDMTLMENRIVGILNNLATWDPRKGSES